MNPPNNEELKACPRNCPSERSIEGSDLSADFYVRCSGCGWTGPNARYKADAVEYWNTRPAPAESHVDFEVAMDAMREPFDDDAAPPPEAPGVDEEEYPIGPNPRESPTLEYSHPGGINPNLHNLVAYFHELSEHYEKPHNRASINSVEEHKHVLSARSGRADAYRHAEAQLANMLQWHGVREGAPPLNDTQDGGEMEERAKVFRRSRRNQPYVPMDELLVLFAKQEVALATTPMIAEIEGLTGELGACQQYLRLANRQTEFAITDRDRLKAEIETAKMLLTSASHGRNIQQPARDFLDKYHPVAAHPVVEREEEKDARS